ncbi:HNH endonuclease [Candidatus Poribacteria bacterium]|nr:HNH endonuclease [Candidatus Poribacteria bacterium]
MRRPYIPSALRRLVVERAGQRCEYCQMPAEESPDIFELEHVIAHAKGGPTTADNLAFACPGCNRYKGVRSHARHLQTGHRVPLFNPRRQRWERHFAWSSDGTQIMGRTATGQATIDVLRMNRPAMGNLRRAWYAVGVHPAQTGEAE